MPELAKALCPICGLEVNDLGIHVQADKEMLEIAKLRHPEVETPDGIDPKCLEKLRQCTGEGLSCGFFTGAVNDADGRDKSR